MYLVIVLVGNAARLQLAYRGSVGKTPGYKTKLVGFLDIMF